jgi:hypothetical protein
VTNAEVARLKSEFYPEEKWNSVSVRSRVHNADLSLSELDDIITSLGGVLCGCLIRKPLGPMGRCDECGVCGPEYAEAVKRVSGYADHYVPIDWRSAWKEEDAKIRWLVEPVLEEGALVALYGRPGDGKSLVTLWMCLQVVRNGGTVLMCDDENTAADLVSRLRAFGATPDELDNLVTFSFASLPPLDTPEGGAHLTALAEKYKPDLITLDTISRLVQGDENAASTYLQLYRCSMTPLKARRITVLRIDHAGKETGRGQRGSSAKAGDVDVVWRLSRESDEFLILEREKSRNGHCEPVVCLQIFDSPHLRFEVDACSLVDGQVMEIAKRLDRYGAALNCTRESAEALLHEYNIKAGRHEKVSAALKYRRDQARSGDGGQGTW